MENHYNLLGLLWITYGVLNLAAELASVFLGVVFWGGGQPLGILGLALFYIPGIVGGVMLRRRHRWARWLLLVFALLNMISFPIGTALGIYTFFVLLRRRRQQVNSE